MAFDCLIQAPLGSPIRGGDQLIIHLRELIEGLVGRLHEAAGQPGGLLGHVEAAEAWDTRLRRVPREGFG